jgi:S-adenosylmethionine hydrolase
VLVSFLSDFGLDDPFVGICHGVMRRIAPGLEIVDITHGIAPGAVLHGALTLADAVPYLPAGVHLAVVDPGVGGERRAIALDAGGRFFVGPDNGLLLPAAETVGGVHRAHELTNEEYALTPVAATFHGRDVFAPAAAHLALGVALAELGPELEPAGLVRPHVPEPWHEEGVQHVTVLAVDRFGNLQLNVDRVDHELLEVEVREVRREARLARTYADGRPGELLLLTDSTGRLAVAVPGGSAAEALAARPGDELRLRPLR